ncbi:MAG: hypothetical protein IKA62_01910 [Clostridia bacterium]|nr:hypothetical protein [Clostridia bacterium]
MKQHDFRAEVDEYGKTKIVVADAPKRRKIDIVPMIVCFFIALFMWIYMINLNDTGVTATMTLPIEIEGIDELRANSGMMLYGVDKEEVVITVKGSNRDIKRFTQADYRASINVGDITQSGRHSRTVLISVPTGSTITVETKEHLSVNFYTDVNITKKVPFDFVQGNWITNPSYTYTIEKNADFVDVSGPKSIIDTIEAARFRIPDDKYETGTNFSGFALSFLDKNGDSVTYDSSVVNYSTSNISVKVIVSTKKLIPLEIKLPEGVSGIHANPGIDSIYVQGDPYLLASVNKYTVTLSEEDIAAGGTILFTLTGEDLPGGVSFVTPDQILRITIVPLELEGSDAANADVSEPEESSYYVSETEESSDYSIGEETSGSDVTENTAEATEDTAVATEDTAEATEDTTVANEDTAEVTENTTEVTENTTEANENATE